MRFKCSRRLRSSASGSTAGCTNAYTINRMAARLPPTSASSNFQSASSSFNALPHTDEESGTQVEQEGTPCGNAPWSVQDLLVPHDLLSYKMVRDSAMVCARRRHRIAQHANPPAFAGNFVVNAGSGKISCVPGSFNDWGVKYRRIVLSR